ncbi:MAG TPA: rhodanese-like domain-containing protein [Rhizomicrobium sp.]|jgi:rhodanese-related sulfurtransferase|nr:rhodanese-like domain-containing protein [Rhizomicrobium sp.]
MSSSASHDYAGDLELGAAWDLLAKEAAAQLVDVRTVAEWNFVGLPDLSTLAREPHRIEWQSYPSMQINPHFVADATERLQAAGAGHETPLLFLCRSGARSRAAAVAMTRAGFQKAFNIAGGFEGALDEDGHRGTVDGWKAIGLPWRQT